MKLEFEKWIEGQGMHEKAREFFNEAIVCFKVAAYRGAFMLSYLGFQTMIRERLLVSDPPSSNLMPDPSAWTGTLQKLRTPTDWDSEVNRLIAVDNSKTEKNIFMISKDVRKEAVFWKDKRNACVHAKDHISYPSVECLWMFIQNHSGKFMVNSGIEAFVQQAKSHFNPVENDPTSDFSELLNRITSVVHDDQYDELFTRLSQALPLHLRSKDYVKKFWLALANSHDARTRENFLDYLKNHMGEFETFIFVFPELLRYFSAEESTLRKFWNQHLPMLTVYEEYAINLYQITHWLFANNKIPPSEWDDFWNNWTRSRILDWLADDLSEDFVALLHKYGYFEAYRKYLLAESSGYSNRMSWYRHEKLLPFYLINVEMDAEFVDHLNRVLRIVPLGSFTNNIRKAFYANDERVRKSFKEICDQLGIQSYYG
ncbi:hypothetical protein K0T92_17135 [Paenibacillus oenotherae]|uniref:Uncharacterized protein n=1 Tax=Paenibacillus oenotherae TaxID=1435645 RepID=A0ABS7D9B7_9BACL|nr:hypothetical protein [Paenibacillus oenotherae]MBW7476460.1 hypothetical protein [Paenibacillus oenotherae]